MSFHSFTYATSYYFRWSKQTASLESHPATLSSLVNITENMNDYLNNVQASFSLGAFLKYPLYINRSSIRISYSLTPRSGVFE